MLSSIFAHVKLPLFPANMTQLLLPQQSIAMDSNQPITTTAWFPAHMRRCHEERDQATNDDDRWRWRLQKRRWSGGRIIIRRSIHSAWPVLATSYYTNRVFDKVKGMERKGDKTFSSGIMRCWMVPVGFFPLVSRDIKMALKCESVHILGLVG